MRCCSMRGTISLGAVAKFCLAQTSNDRRTSCHDQERDTRDGVVGCMKRHRRSQTSCAPHQPSRYESKQEVEGEVQEVEMQQGKQESLPEIRPAETDVSCKTA